MIRICLALFCVLGLLSSQDAWAGNKVYDLSETAKVRNITLVMSTTSVLMFSEEIGSYAVGDPDTADVLPIRGREAYIQGKKLGSTNLTVMSADGVRRAVFNIEVTLNVSGISKTIRKAEPAANIEISTANGRVILSGDAPDVPSAERIVEIVGKFVDAPSEVINAITIDKPQQVMLEVRFLEVSRSIDKGIGVNLYGQNRPNFLSKSGDPGLAGLYCARCDAAGPSALGVLGSSAFATIISRFAIGGLDIDAIIRALEEKGVTRRLAEPNLVALSGHEATFLAGGEIPYQVDNGDGGNTTEFRKYGVQLTFTPTVLRDGIINLKLTPEFSQPDTGGAPITGEPPLLTRQAQTMVELRDGQTFVIAGLLDGFNSRGVDQVPGIGDIPVLGTLFRSSSFQKRETELIIVVTPRLVKPMVPGTPLATPLDTLRSSTEAELFLAGELERKPERKNPTSPSVGVIGHILDLGG